MWPNRLTFLPKLKHTATNTLMAVGLFLLVFMGAKAFAQIRSDALVKGKPFIQEFLEQNGLVNRASAQSVEEEAALPETRTRTTQESTISGADIKSEHPDKPQQNASEKAASMQDRSEQEGPKPKKR